MVDEKILLWLGIFMFDLSIFLYALLIFKLKIKIDDEYVKGQKKKLWGMNNEKSYGAINNEKT